MYHKGDEISKNSSTASTQKESNAISLILVLSKLSLGPCIQLQRLYKHFMQSHNVHSYDEFLLSDDQVPTPGDSSTLLLEFDQPAVIRSDDDHDAYRSPPFIQAPLPDDDILDKRQQRHSPQPLPVRPRIAMSTNPDSTALALSGHTRSPILAR
jgi:hypothetical protein